MSPTPQAPPPKRNCLLGFTTGCAVLSLFAGIACLAAWALWDDSRSLLETASAPATATATARVPTTRFENSREELHPNLASHYLDFSFDYPQHWKLTPSDESNFVKVEHARGDGQTIENFAVGWFEGPAVTSALPTLYPQIAAQLSAQFAAQFPNYEKVSEGPARIGEYDGYEFRFRGWAASDGGDGRTDFWGRTVILPGVSSTNGVALVMFTTSHSPDIRGPEDVGTRGELPVILQSFRMK